MSRSPEELLGPRSLLYCGYHVPFAEVRRHPPSSSDKVKEILELYMHFSYWLSWVKVTFNNYLFIQV